MGLMLHSWKCCLHLTGPTTIFLELCIDDRNISLNCAFLVKCSQLALQCTESIGNSVYQYLLLLPYVHRGKLNCLYRQFSLPLASYYQQVLSQRQKDRRSPRTKSKVYSAMWSNVHAYQMANSYRFSCLPTIKLTMHKFSNTKIL